MDDKERRRFEMLMRVRNFGSQNAADFPAQSIGGQALTEISTVVDELEQVSAVRTANQANKRQESSRKVTLREELREDLQAMSRTARAMSTNVTTEIDDKFRMPRGNNDQELLTAARAFAASAIAHKADFINYGLPSDFIEDLENDIKAFEQAANAQNTAATGSVAGTAAIDAAIERGMSALRRFDAIVYNKYRNDAAKLAAWMSASHVERAPKTTASAPPKM